MKVDFEWLYLKFQIFTFISCLMFGIAVSGASWCYKNNIQSIYISDLKYFESARSLYNKTQEEKKLLQNYYPKLINLYNNGVLGEEPRLNWVETLLSAGEQIDLPNLKYSIYSQKRYKPDFPVETGQYQIFISVMNLNIGLLHELDLQKILTILDEEALGIYNISKCLFRKKISINLDEANISNISVECDLIWFNIKTADGSNIHIS